MNFRDLPALAAELDGGLFAGLTTDKTGQHFAVIVLPARSEKPLTWKKAVAWAEKAGGVLPTRPVSAMLFANVREHIATEGWYWTSEEAGSCAWYQYFGYGGQGSNHKSYEGRAVAVRLIPVSADEGRG